MKHFILAVIAGLAVVVEASVAPYVSIHGVKPDIVMVYVVLVGMLGGAKDAGFVGFFAGLLEDVSSGQFLGLFILTRVITGLAASLSYEKVFQDRVVVPVALVFLGGVFGGVLHLFLLSSFGVPLSVSPASLRVVLCQAAYSAAIAPLALSGVARINLYTRGAANRRRAL
ncbi:MAG: rod shape-determining protein MreD [Bacillota bacterium]